MHHYLRFSPPETYTFLSFQVDGEDMLPLLAQSFVGSLRRTPSLRAFHAVACVDSHKLNDSKQHRRKTLNFPSFQQNPVRRISSESVRASVTHLVTECFGPDTLFVNSVMKCLTVCHEGTGLPWWATIFLVTVSLKASVVFPLSVHARKAEARRSKMNEEMLALLPQLEKEVQILARSRGYSPQDARKIFNINVCDYYSVWNIYILDSDKIWTDILSLA